MPYRIEPLQDEIATTPGIQPSGFDPTRQIVRSGARAAESAAGLPSDIAQFFSSLLSTGAKGAGMLGPGMDPFGAVGPILRSPQVSGVLEDLPLPTSSKIREYITTPIAEKIAGKGYLDPQSSKEELSDAFIGDLTALMMPIGGKLPFAKSLATAGLGNVAKYAAKEYQLPEWAQEGIKLGTMMAVNFAGPDKFKDIASNLSKDAQSAITKDSQTSVRPLKPTIDKLGLLFEKGDLPADWGKKLAHLDREIINNKIPIQEVWDLSKDLNNLFYGQKKPSAFKRAFSDMKNDINSTMKEYGKTNPQFYSNWSESNSLFNSLKKADKITSFLDKNLNTASIGLGTAGMLLGLYSPTRYLSTLGGAYAVKKGIQAKNLFGNRTALKYFSKTIESAASKNIRQMNHFAKKLDKELAKTMASEEKIGKYRID